MSRRVFDADEISDLQDRIERLQRQVDADRQLLRYLARDRSGLPFATRMLLDETLIKHRLR